jgi:hypothetical protein
MMTLPEIIEARLVDEAGQPLRAANVLVGINFLAEGRYYYGNILGLTNDEGRISIRGEALERRYLGDRRRFPMDYKLELVECDNQFELAVLSAQEVDQGREALKDDPLANPEMLTAYVRAKNGRYQPGLVRVHTAQETVGLIPTKVK